MTTRRLLALSAAALAAACEPKVPHRDSSATVVAALFDPLKSEIPLPNDLLLAQDPATLGLPAAQVELLNAFRAQGGFPADQEVAVTIGFARSRLETSGVTTRAAPQLDLASFGPGTLFVWGITAAGQGEVPLDPIAASDYALVSEAGGGSHGVLTLHHRGRQPWPAGRYMVFLRGGGSGVRTTDGEPVEPSPTFFLVLQGQDMTSAANQTFLRTQTGSAAAALAAGQQLNQLIAATRPALAVANTRFPASELAVLTTFAVAKMPTHVELDPGRGLVPLPIDLLRDPRPPSATCAACGKLTPLAACTLAGGTLSAAGTCSSAAAAGFAALDGFSTTGPLLAATSDLVQAGTVTSSGASPSYFLYDLTSPAAPVLVSPASYVAEPCEFASSGLSPVIAAQPAGATACDASSVFRTRPLKDDTEYAVVVTDGVKDKTGTAIGPGTVGKILLFDNPLVSATGASQLQGIDDQTAGALEVMRRKLLPVRAAVAGAGVAKAHIAMAYTFKTQSFLKVAAQLGALPYTQPLFTALPGAVTALAPAAAFAKYGVDPNVVPSSHIGEVLETTITTFNLLDPATGAFHADPAQATAETIRVLIATPQAANPNLSACAGAMAPFAPLRCAPMVVFRHGLGGGRADMLAVADGLAAAGLVTVAIDAAKHGDRSFCTGGSTTIPGTAIPVCADRAACVTALAAGAQGDANPPGTCAGGFTKRPVNCPSLATCGWSGADGIPLVSSNYLVSANFFRTRDTFRQDIIDESQLVRAIAFVPSSAPPTGHGVFDRTASVGLFVIDPNQVFYAGQSLGALHGTMTVATNPRISRAALNVGGGTVTDIFTTSPAFASGTSALLAGLGITPGTASYLQFLAVAKTVLDPADPLNYAGHLTDGNLTLPNLLPPLGGAVDGSVKQTAKNVLAQVAFCDQVVPNPFNYLWASTLGVGPTPAAPTFGAPGTFQLFYKGTAAPSAADLASCPAPGGSPLPAGAVSHGFLTNWSDAVITGRAQADAAAFLHDKTAPPSLTVLP